MKIFEEKGLTRIWGENVALVEKELVTVCTRLYEVGELPDETVIDILTGLTKCSVEQFRKIFDHLLQKEQLALLEHATHPKSTIDRVKEVLIKAVDTYNSLSTLSKWHTPCHQRAAACWNWEKEGCNVNSCPQQKDQKRIAENRKKYLESKNKNGAGNRSDGGGKSGGGGYSRSKWGAPDHKSSGIAFVDGKLQCW